MFFCRSRPRQLQFKAVGVLAKLDQRREPNAESTGTGPKATMIKLDCRLASESERNKWLEESRMDAILGASSRSHKSVRSGIRCWIAFVGMWAQCLVCLLLAVNCSCTDQFDPDKKRYFPPPLDLLLSWTTLFRSGGTLRNYLGYLQTGCLMVDAPTQVRLFQ